MSLLMLQESAGCYMFVSGILKRCSAAGSEDSCGGWENGSDCWTDAITVIAAAKYPSRQMLANCQLW